MLPCPHGRPRALSPVAGHPNRRQKIPPTAVPELCWPATAVRTGQRAATCS